MLVKNYRPRGMDLRSSELNRPPEYAKDIVNMEPNSGGEWEKRDGFNNLLTDAGIIDDQKYKAGSEQIYLYSTGLKRRNAAAMDTIPYGFDISVTAPTWTAKASWVEYNGCLYATDPDGVNELYKYDGGNFYRAGMRKPVFNSYTSAGGAKYYRIAFYFVDLQGQIHWGDYHQTGSITATDLNVDTLLSEEFRWRFGDVSGNQTINSGTRTLTTVAGHNYIVGDKVRVLTSASGYEFWEVEAETGTTITFTAASIGSDSSLFTTALPIEYRNYAMVWGSDNEFYGYSTSSLYGSNLNSQAIGSAANTNVSTISVFSGTQIPMEDIYDTTKLKGLPPRFKYIDIYNNVMVGANNSKSNNVSSGTIGLTEDIQNDKSALYWSDLGVGSTIETFAPDDKTVIGKSNEGDMLGLFASTDSIILFKELQVYYLNGILTGRLFRTRSALTNNIGCVAHRSIVQFEGGCMFMSARGLYFVRNGATPTELSDIIEPYFTQDTTGLDFTTAVSILDEKREKTYTYIQSTVETASDSVICYDYKHQDWFKYAAMSARGGFHMFNNILYYADSSGNVFERQVTKADGTSAISAKYESAYWNMGSPSLKKKFVNFILLSLTSTTWTANVKSQCDWTATIHTDETEVMSPTIPVENIPLGMDKAYAMSFTIENNIINENMVVSGYEFEYEEAQTKPRGAS